MRRAAEACLTPGRAAVRLFGKDWARKVKDVPDAFFADYRPGEPVR